MKAKEKKQELEALLNLKEEEHKKEIKQKEDKWMEKELQCKEGIEYVDNEILEMINEFESEIERLRRKLKKLSNNQVKHRSD